MGDKATLKVALREQGHEQIKSILKQLATKAVHWLLAWRKLSEGDLSPPSCSSPQGLVIENGWLSPALRC